MSDAYLPWQTNDPEEPWPKSAVGSITLPDGAKVPTYYCLKCEGKSAVEGRPQTAELIEKYGSEATIHICFGCAYDREVTLPADIKESA